MLGNQAVLGHSALPSLFSVSVDNADIVSTHIQLKIPDRIAALVSWSSVIV